MLYGEQAQKYDAHVIQTIYDFSKSNCICNSHVRLLGRKLHCQQGALFFPMGRPGIFPLKISLDI
jgi:hypothetical protein